MRTEEINDVIKNYEDEDLQRFLLSKDNEVLEGSIIGSLQLSLDNFRNTIEEPIYNVNIDLEQFDTVFVPDIHGNLDNLLKILYAQGLIDKEGNWCGGNRYLVQLGDTIDRGAKSWETVLYLRILQQQARKNKGDIVLLLGNHEQAILNDTTIEPQNFYFKDYKKLIENNQLSTYEAKSLMNREKNLLRTIFQKDMERGDMKACYLDRNHHLIMATHADICLKQEKIIYTCFLQDVLDKKNLKLTDRNINYLSLDEIKSTLTQLDQSLESFVDWINSYVKKYIMSALDNHPILGKKGITWSQEYINECRFFGKNNLEAIPKPNVLMHIVAHIDTRFSDIINNPNLSSSQSFINHETANFSKRFHHTFYTDGGIVDGNLGCIAMKEGVLFELKFDIDKNMWVFSEKFDFNIKECSLQDYEIIDALPVSPREIRNKSKDTRCILM